MCPVKQSLDSYPTFTESIVFNSIYVIFLNPKDDTCYTLGLGWDSGEIKEFFNLFFLDDGGLIDLSGEPLKYYGLYGEILELIELKVVHGKLL